MAFLSSFTLPQHRFWNRERLVWLGAEVGTKHVAEQLPLLDGIVERHMRVRHGIEPVRGHRLLFARTIWFAQQRHRVGLDINCRITEWGSRPRTR